MQLRPPLCIPVLLGALALAGCSGPAATVPTPEPQHNASYQAMLEQLANAAPPSGTFEIIDAETGAVVGSMPLVVNDDGTFGIDGRGGQDITYGPVQNAVFRVGVIIEEDGPNAPAGYSANGNALYYIGQNVEYDVRVQRRFPVGSMLAQLGGFDMSITHLMANNMMFPSCVAGQNPNVVTGIDFATQQPNGGNYSWGGAQSSIFTASDQLFKLCPDPAVVYGTDKINIQIQWVIPGAELGLPCTSCELRINIFNRDIGVYDP